MSSPFEEEIGMTYIEAKAFLKSISQWDKYKDQDGYSIVLIAKSILEEKNARRNI